MGIEIEEQVLDHKPDITEYKLAPEPDLGNIEDLVSEILPIAKFLCKIPGKKDYDEFERRELYRAVIRIGYDAVNQMLASKLAEDGICAAIPKIEKKPASKYKPRGYWTKLENILNELEPIIVEKGKFPTIFELRKIDRNDIITSTMHYFKNWKNLKTALAEYVENSPLLEKKNLLPYLKAS